MNHRRYSPELSHRTYDAIVIGSGLGGLTTASILARHGKSVLILERHNVPGGFTHTFKRKGFEWDVGVHYVGQVGDEKSLMRKLFDYVTDSRLKWEPMGDIYDRVYIGKNRFDFITGRDKLIASLIERFPNDEVAIRKYFDLIKSIGMSSALYFGERSMPWFLSYTVGYFMRRRMLKFSSRTTYDVLAEITKNEELLAVLCSQCGDYGLSPKESSFGVHAGLVEHYLEGGNYPVGGAKSIHQAMLEGIESRGGRLALATEVKKVLVDKNRAIGVELANGDKIYGRKIVSNAGARNTYGRLWPESIPVPDKIKNDLAQIKPSMSHICLYVGLNSSDKDLKLPKHNIWLYKSSDFDGDFAVGKGEPTFEPMLTYISFPSAKDSAWAQNHPQRSTVQVIAPCPFEWVEKWQSQPWMKRDEEYQKFKKQWQEALLEKLYSVAPDIRGHVEHCEVSTPLSTKHFSNYQNGEIYGLEHTPRRMNARWLRVHTPIKNLYMTGQDVVMVGVGGALFSGVVTSVALLRRNVLAPLFKAKVN